MIQPYDSICSIETKNNFYRACSFVCMLKNKRLNYANILIILLQEKKLIRLFKNLCSFENDFECIRFFLECDPNIYKSKYIKRFLKKHYDNVYRKENL